MRLAPLYRGPRVCWCFYFFFFSSRRRHTRLQGDWSSDVCSSDLEDDRGLERVVRDRDGVVALEAGPPGHEHLPGLNRVELLHQDRLEAALERGIKIGRASCRGRG